MTGWRIEPDDRRCPCANASSRRRSWSGRRSCDSSARGRPAEAGAIVARKHAQPAARCTVALW